jgi:hypothetical protein
MNVSPFPASGSPIALADQLPGFRGHLVVTPDEGRSWLHTAIDCCRLFSENPRFAAARPTVGGERPVGYPDVVYFCANNTVGFTGPIIWQRICLRTLDGGRTWHERSVLLDTRTPRHPECAGSGEQVTAIDGNYPQAASDGSLYVTVVCGGRTYLARSTDEGATWPILRAGGGRPLEIPAGDELRIDEGDGFLRFRVVDGRLRLRVSGDRGRTWGAERDITAPGVAAVGTWFPAVRGAGHAAVAYYGQRQGRDSSDGWITETRDAFAADPVFWSATVNSPSRPLLLSADGTRYPGPGFLDYNGADIGPDGTPWGSFVQDCEAGARDAACADGGAEKAYAARGFAGHLQWPTG